MAARRAKPDPTGPGPGAPPETRTERRRRRNREALIKAGAFDSIDGDRCKLLASVGVAMDFAEQAERNAMQTSLFDIGTVAAVAGDAAAGGAATGAGAGAGAGALGLAGAPPVRGITMPGMVDIKVSVGGLRKVIEGLKMEQTGTFIRYNGEVLPW